MQFHNKTSQPMLKKILVPMVLLTLIEVFLLVFIFVCSGTIPMLDKNAQNVVHGKVTTRAAYLQNIMINDWSNLSHIAQNINDIINEFSTNGSIRLDALEEISEGNSIYSERVANVLIDMLRTNKVTGAFVVFTSDSPETLRQQDSFERAGICLRDYDPTTSPSEQNNDILIERGSIELVRSLGIATDGNWMPKYQFSKDMVINDKMLLNSLEQAYSHPEATPLSELGYWSEPHLLIGDDKPVISYTVPLIASDGTIYGILGSEITLDHLSTVLPAEELIDNGPSGYMLLTINSENNHRTVFSSNPKITERMAPVDVKKSADEVLTFTGNDNKKYYLDIKTIKLYDSNAPFEAEQWGVAGAVAQRDLTQSSRYIFFYIVLVVFFTILVGIVGSVLVSIMISRPMQQVSRHLRRMDIKKQLDLPRTNIYEFDQLEKSIEKLSSDVIDSSTKFAQILDKASIRIAGFDINTETKELFITDGFFSIFGIDDLDINAIDIWTFIDEMSHLKVYLDEEGTDYSLYKIPLKNETAYIRLSYTVMENGRYVGAIEDITNSILEKRSVEHERDHDMLTGLKNRRAFQRIMQTLFQKGDSVLKVAALVMIDLDHLKHINDKYGHDYGDKYIQTAANSFRKYAPENTLICRNSGDEFYLFYYGYSKQDDIKKWLKVLREGLDQEFITLASNQKIRLGMSGGISWYPKDSIYYEKLLQYSDFAMYQVKHSTKGAFGDFDLGAYHSEEYLLQSKKELDELICNQKVEFYFQPIVDTLTGNVVAYEALMRGLMPTLRYPSEILSLARSERKLSAIEDLTWEVATSTFKAHIDNGLINQNCKLFINSLPDYIPDEEVLVRIESECKSLLENFVVEITEDAEMDTSVLENKRSVLANWKADLALDDYGSGYNGEKVLIQLAPQYIKIDRDIISSIHENADKQKLLQNTVSYAKERNIKIIAEGIETVEEMQMVISLGVDYLQGYYLAQPALIPPQISKHVTSEITMIY